VNPAGVGGLRKNGAAIAHPVRRRFPIRGDAEQVKLLNECGVFNAKEIQAIYSENIGQLLPKYRA